MGLRSTDMTGLPWEVAAWLSRKPGRRIERQAGGAIALIDVLPTNDTRTKLDTAEVRRTYPSLTAACAAVAL